MTLTEALDYLISEFEENDYLKVEDYHKSDQIFNFSNILKTIPNFKMPEGLQLKETNLGIRFEYEGIFYLVSLKGYQDIDEFEVKTFETEEALISESAQNELIKALEVLKEKAEYHNIYENFKRTPNFYDWLTHSNEPSLEFVEIEIIEQFRHLSANKHSTYQYWIDSYFENRGVFYHVNAGGWQQGDYSLDSVSFKKFENEEACRNEILETKLKEYSLFNKTSRETSAYQLLTTLEAASSEGLIKELMRIFEKFSKKTKQNFFAKLKAHLEESE